MNLREFKHYVDRERAAGREPPPVMLDNDQVSAHDEGSQTYIYDSDPYTILREALDMLGIPHEEV